MIGPSSKIGAVAVTQLGPIVGFAGLAVWAKSRQRLDRRERRVFLGMSAVLVPICVLGLWVGAAVLAKWGL